MNTVCVDASFALKLVIPEPESEDVAAMWEEWQTTGRNVVSPWLFAFEVLAVLRRKVFRKELSSTEGRRAWEILSDLAIELRHHDRTLDKSMGTRIEVRSAHHLRYSLSCLGSSGQM